MDNKNPRSAHAWLQAFSAWEVRCRGWNRYDFAVELEPPFRPIVSKSAAPTAIVDDARSRGGLNRVLTKAPAPPQTNRQLPCDPLIPRPKPYYRIEDVAELELLFPRDLEITPAISEQLLLSLGHFRDPIAFEFMANENSVSIQLACDRGFSEYLGNQCAALLPDLGIARRDGFLKGEFDGSAPTVIVDMGLSRNFLLPLRQSTRFDPDPLAGLIGSLSFLRATERAALQVMFIPAGSHWSEAIHQALSDPDHRKVLEEANSEVLAATKTKLASTLFAVSIRLISRADSTERCWTILKELGGNLQQFTDPRANELIALAPDGYPPNDHRLSLFTRTNYRTGMLLSASELVGLVHLPASVTCEKLPRTTVRTKRFAAAPNSTTARQLLLGENLHAGISTAVRIDTDLLTKHIFVAGGSGGGKSNFLCNCVRQIAEQNYGFALIDPAGDLVDDVIARLPEDRLDQVVLFDASDTEFPIGFNPLEARTDAERYLLSSDLLSLLKRHSTSWGPMMEAAVSQATNAFLYNPRGGTLADLKQFLIDRSFRAEVLSTVEDEGVRFFWHNESAGINVRSLGSVLIRLDGFLRHPIIRGIVTQRRTKLNIREFMDEGKILLVKISQGLVGEANSALLASLLVSKIYQTALSRQDTELAHRKPFFVVADEAQNYLTESLGLILAGTRKYGCGLVLSTQSHHVLQSRDPETSESILANSLVRLCFRLSDDDAQRLARGFNHFTAEDLQKLGVGEAICRIERSDKDFNLRTLPPITVSAGERRERMSRVIERSRSLYAISRRSGPEKTLAHSSQASPTSVADSHIRSMPNEAQTTAPAKISLPQTAGPHHREIQLLIKRIAEDHGFMATIEEGLAGGGQVDLSIQAGERRIACEISVSTTDYEVHNVEKCLAAGFDFVVVVVAHEKKANLIRSKLLQARITGVGTKVKILALQELLAFLRGISDPQVPASAVTKPAGSRLSFVEASELLSISSSTLYRWIRDGRVPFYRVGRVYQFDRAELLLLGRQDLSGKRNPIVKLPPMTLDERSPKSKKQQDTRYRKLLDLD